MSQIQKEALIEEIRRYLTEVRVINDQISVYSSIIKCRKNNECLEKLNIAPSFFNIVIYSLTVSIILAISRLYDTGKSEKTISKILGKCKDNIELFNFKIENGYIDESSGLVETHLVERDSIFERIKEYESRNEELKRTKPLNDIKILRDKIFAHNDKKYFMDQIQVPNIAIDDVKSLVKFAENLLNELLLNLNGESMMSDSQNIDDFKKLINSVNTIE